MPVDTHNYLHHHLILQSSSQMQALITLFMSTSVLLYISSSVICLSYTMQAVWVIMRTTPPTHSSQRYCYKISFLRALARLQYRYFTNHQYWRRINCTHSDLVIKHARGSHCSWYCFILSQLLSDVSSVTAGMWMWQVFLCTLTHHWRQCSVDGC